MRVLRRRSYRRWQNRPVPRLISVLNVAASRRGAQQSGMYARYDAPMGSRRINREAWATIVEDLVFRHCRGKKAPFARIVGVAPRTVDRWLRAEVDVSEASVREVARALGIPAVDLLVAAGYFDARDLADVQGDPALQMIYESDLPDHVKDRLVERLREMRQRELDDVQWWIEQARGA